jgi:hypothetical protein
MLHALVVPAPDNFAVANEDGANGNPSGSEAFPGFINRGLEKWVHGSEIFETTNEHE